MSALHPLARFTRYVVGLPIIALLAMAVGRALNLDFETVAAMTVVGSITWGVAAL